MNVCGVILSGGKSSRMRANKSLLKLHHKTVIEHVSDELKKCCNNLIVITNEPEDYQFLGLPFYSDRFQDKGPLAGMETAIYHVDADAYLIAACDMPFINKQVYQYLLSELHDFDAVVPMFEERLHPLVGIYRPTILAKIQNQLANDELRIRDLFTKINVNFVKDFSGFSSEVLRKHFFNMNNPTQYEQAKTF